MTWILRFSITLLVTFAWQPGFVQGQNISGYDTVEDPLLFLLREPAVHREMKLTPAQAKQLIDLNDQHDPQLLAARTWPTEKALRLNYDIRHKSRQAIEQFLDQEQIRRIDQIGFRALGIRFVLIPQVRQTLGISDDQVRTCTAAVEDAAQKISELREQVVQGQLERSAAERSAAEVRENEQKHVFAALSEAQQKQLIELIGSSFDVAQLGQVSFRAPDVKSDGVWINSAPLSLKDLRGKVVAVHFWTFGCSNCIQNYPWYRDWQSAFGKKGLVIVGVHTPESEGERDEARIRETIQREKFQFPVVVDNDRKVWETWGNGIWPSVYLVDKRGRLRFWWYGELNWNGAGGQKIMADRIEQLLDEPA